MEQWLPERQLQPNQIKYYYQCLLEKSFKRLHKKTNDEKKKIKKQTAKPFIVRIPHLQPKSTLNTESGKVVLVKTTGESSTTNLPLQQKSFSIVKLADGQIILVPTTNENGISKIIKASSPPKSQPQTVSISPQERRLRPIAPAPITSIQTSNELLNSLLAQQQQQSETTILHLEDPTLLTTITIDTNSSKVEPTPRVVTQKTKNIRKTIPIPSITDDKKIKISPEEIIRYDAIPFLPFLIVFFFF
jgi:hypothetical protein